jgi:hypothetical protein
VGQPDTIPPQVSGLSLTPNPPATCQLTHVSAQVTDNIGVQSVSVQWTYQGSTQSTSMTPAGGSTYSASLALGGNGGDVAVTVQARDAAGNTSSASTKATVQLC